MKIIEQLILRFILRRLERQMKDTYDRILSRRIDAVRFLLEETKDV